MKYIEAYNLIDLFIMGTLLVTLILGIWKGFVRSLTALASVVIGALFAAKYYPVIQPYLNKVSSLDPHISMILSMVIIFVAVQAVFVVIRRILDALIDLTRLSWLDRCLGAAMGVVAGFLVVACTVQAILIGIPDWPVVKTSKLIPPAHRLSEEVLARSPKQIKEQVHAFVTKWKGTSEPSQPTPKNRSAANNAPAAAPGLAK
ncbi:MAG: CvpA family protein [Desulfomonile tiedjei]|nr:CvpA family protein [Desulfomonile tiedjei]